MSRDEKPPQNAAAGGWREQFAHRLAKVRADAQASLQARRERLTSLEGELSERARKIAQERKAQSAAEAEQRAAKVPDEVVQRQQTLLDEVMRQLEQLDQAQSNQRQQQSQLTSLAADCSRQEVELDKLRQAVAEREAELAQEQASLADERRRLAAENEQLAQQQAQWEQQQADFTKRQAELAAQSQTLAEQLQTTEKRARATDHQRRELAQQFRAQKAELAAEAERLRAEAALAAGSQDAQIQVHLAEERSHRERLEAQLVDREKQLAEARAELKQLKRQLEERLEEAVKLREKLREAEAAKAHGDAVHAQLVQELAALRTTAASDSRRAIELEAQFEPLKQQLADCQAECRKQTEQAQHSAAEVMRLAAEMAALAQESDKRLSALHEGQMETFNGRLAELVNQIERLSQEREHQQEQVHALRDAMQHHERATSEWEHRCRDLEQQLAHAKQASAAPSADQEDLRRRLELALADLRELKTRNQEVNEQLEKAKAGGGSGGEKSSPAARAAGDALDWAERKRLLLEQLETDFDVSDAKQKQDKLTVQEAIALTDQVVAEKDRLLAEKDKELAELHHILSNQASAMGGMAVGAAAIGAMLDQDELIKSERENLKRQTEELREKLSRAEIDISMERAKLARERAELEEQLQTIEREKALRGGPSSESADDIRKSGPRGNWLSRLGLKDKP
jgi:DNA repair exonuclease SbcCD ATPase subunit